MIHEKSLVIYKNHPALVNAIEGDKINITVSKGKGAKPEIARVRVKDIELLHPGPCTLKDLEETTTPGAGSETAQNAVQGAAPQDVRKAVQDAAHSAARDAWELLLESESPSSLKELAELAFGSYSPRTAWAAYELLEENLYFSGDVSSIKARTREAVEEDEKKREEKQRESGERAAFLEKLKKLPPFREGVPSGAETFLSPAEHRFMSDVEALALGRSEKSKTLKELGKSETPEEAHRMLLAAGVWTVWVNPHSDRFNSGRDLSKSFSLPPEEERIDLAGLPSFAIDNPWSKDPDDAVSLEGPDADGCHLLWVHVSDPAASILPGSPADKEARDRGATLYLPEKPFRMLDEETQAFFALGFGDRSPALSFKIKLKPDLTIADVEILPSLVNVTRLSYGEADSLMNGDAPGTASETATGAAGQASAASMLSSLAALMDKNLERRLDSGAVLIELPDVYIKVTLDKNTTGSGINNSVSVLPLDSFRSADMVRECMVLAGEGAARWALQRQLPFPFISQEAGELPATRLPGLAGAWQLRRCMRSRVLSAKPGIHWGLGLDEYTQVSSPLRRYTDLICHQQIRSELKSGAYRGLSPLNKEEVLFRVSAAEAAAIAVSKAERASKAHWLAVYLSDKKGTLWDGVVLDRKGNKGVVIIPALGIETQVTLGKSENPNDFIKLSLSSVKIPGAETVFSVL